jgi:hypothetical protein
MSVRVNEYLDAVRLRGVMGQILRRLAQANAPISIAELGNDILGASEDSVYTNVLSAQDQGFVALEKGSSGAVVRLTETGKEAAKSIL